jgi:hypothetical protein
MVTMAGVTLKKWRQKSPTEFQKKSREKIADGVSAKKSPTEFLKFRKLSGL